MATITFDTLKFVERLQAGGVSAVQARAESDALLAALSEAADAYFPSRSDLARLEHKIDKLEAKVDARFEALEAKVDARITALDEKSESRSSALETRMSALEARMDTLELRLTVKLGVMLTAAVGLVAAIVKFL